MSFDFCSQAPVDCCSEQIDQMEEQYDDTDWSVVCTSNRHTVYNTLMQLVGAVETVPSGHGAWRYNMPMWVWSALNTNQPARVGGQKTTEACTNEKALQRGKRGIVTSAFIRQIKTRTFTVCLLFKEGAYFLSMQSEGSQECCDVMISYLCRNHKQSSWTVQNIVHTLETVMVCYIFMYNKRLCKKPKQNVAPSLVSLWIRKGHSV